MQFARAFGVDAVVDSLGDRPAPEAWLDLAVSAGRLGTWRIDYNEAAISGSSQFWEFMGRPSATVLSLAEMGKLVHPQDWPMLANPPDIVQSRRDYDVEIRIRRPGNQIRWIALRGREERGGDRGFRLGIAADLTERRQSTLLRAAVRKQERLMLEQRHRSRNMFGLVAALVKIVGAPDDNLARYKERLMERLRAMEATHLVLGNNADASTTIRDLVTQELKPYAQDGRTTVKGPAIRISGGAAESFAMVVHELTTNSVKHGVLGAPEGRVEVRWELAASKGDDEIGFCWTETGKAPSSPVPRHGFGSMILGVDGAPIIGHSSNMEMTSDGLRYTLRLSRAEL